MGSADCRGSDGDGHRGWVVRERLERGNSVLFFRGERERD
jgi:hypothetical protein